jgi:hypothetical protein
MDGPGRTFEYVYDAVLGVFTLTVSAHSEPLGLRLSGGCEFGNGDLSVLGKTAAGGARRVAYECDGVDIIVSSGVGLSGADHRFGILWTISGLK